MKLIHQLTNETRIGSAPTSAPAPTPVPTPTPVSPITPTPFHPPITIDPNQNKHTTLILILILILSLILIPILILMPLSTNLSSNIYNHTNLFPLSLPHLQTNPLPPFYPPPLSLTPHIPLPFPSP